jgi:hypothetical protein
MSHRGTIGPAESTIPCFRPRLSSRPNGGHQVKRSPHNLRMVSSISLCHAARDQNRSGCGQRRAVHADTPRCGNGLDAVVHDATPNLAVRRSRAGGARSAARRGIGGGDGARESRLSGETAGMLGCVWSQASVYPVGSQSMDSASLGQSAGDPVYRCLSQLVGGSLAADRPSCGAPSWRPRVSHQGSRRSSQPLTSLSFLAAGQAGPPDQCQPWRKRDGEFHLPANRAQNPQTVTSPTA